MHLSLRFCRFNLPTKPLFKEENFFPRREKSKLSRAKLLGNTNALRHFSLMEIRLRFRTRFSHNFTLCIESSARQTREEKYTFSHSFNVLFGFFHRLLFFLLLCVYSKEKHIKYWESENWENERERGKTCEK